MRSTFWLDGVRIISAIQEYDEIILRIKIEEEIGESYCEHVIGMQPEEAQELIDELTKAIKDVEAYMSNIENEEF